MNIPEIECCLVSSALTNEGRPGACLSTALAFWPFWESPEASKLAEGIMKCIRSGRSTNPYNVRGFLEGQYQKWVEHPTFKNGLPLGLAEVEARSILPHYQAKRLIQVVGDTYSKMINKPEAARVLALDLRLRLEEWGK